MNENLPMKPFHSNHPYRPSSVFIFIYVFASLYLAQTVTGNNTNNNDDVLLSNIVKWARAEGAYINEKVHIRHIDGGLSGLFASESLDEGELISSIPWDLAVKNETADYQYKCDAYWAVYSSITKDESLQNPYEKYLAAPKRSARNLPLYWSDQGKAMLKDVFGDFIPTQDLDTEIKFWVDECGADLDDIRSIDAMVLTTGRWEEGKSGMGLIPFNDLINHRNGKWTNTDSETMEGDNLEFYTTRRVKAGEELFYSYTQCSYCNDDHNNPYDENEFLVTPYFFLEYGFVEPMPQRWVFPQVRLLFDIDENDDGSLQARFVAPPSHSGITFLVAELERLGNVMNDMERSTLKVPENEQKSILLFYRALHDAMKTALQYGEGHTSEVVWDSGLRGSTTWYNRKYYTSER